MDDELSSPNSSSISALSSSGNDWSGSIVVGGAVTPRGVRERLLLLLGIVCFVKNGAFVKDETGRGFWGLLLGDESVTVVATEAEIVCGKAINGVFFFKFTFFGDLNC